MQPRAYVGVIGCGPRVLSCWTSSWVSFWVTQHNLSRRQFIQNVTSLSGSAGSLGVAVGTSVCCVQFYFVLLIPTDAGVVVSGMLVSVRAWDARDAPLPAGKEGHHTL